MSEKAAGPWGSEPGDEVGPRLLSPRAATGGHDVGDEVGGWQVTRVLGRGRGGDLLLLRHREEPDRWRALRVLPEQLGPADRRRVAADAVSAPACLHLVRAREVVHEAGLVGVVVDLVEAGTMRRLHDDRGVFTAGELVTAAAPVARALHRLHAAGLAHGAVDLRHVHLDRDGRPWLGDLAGAIARRAVVAAGRGAATADPPGDVLGVGTIAWTCLTGRAPGPPERAWQRPTLARLRPDVPAAVVDAVEGTLAPHAPDRPNAGELADVLLAAVPPEPLPVADDEGAGGRVTRRIPDRFLGGAERGSAPPNDRGTADGDALSGWCRLRPRRRRPRDASSAR